MMNVFAARKIGPASFRPLIPSSFRSMRRPKPIARRA
jgi:hypothetical protein